MNRKVCDGRLRVKNAAQGTVQAVFATLNAIDADGDVALPGAFQDGEEVRISVYNHGSWGPGMLPVGKGVISVQGIDAILDGQFFLSTTAGRDTFETVKQMGDLQEWSYGYDVLDAESGVVSGQPVRLLKRLSVHEVSPVLLGAGVNTRTLGTKARGEQVAAPDFEQEELRFIEARALLRDASWQRLQRMIPR